MRDIVKAGFAPGKSASTNGMSLSGNNSTGHDDPACFGLLVEAEDPRIAIFAASFAAHLLNNFVLSLPGEDDREFLVKIAGLIQAYPETQQEIARLTGDLNESVANINLAIQSLAQLDPGDVLPSR